MVSQLSNMWATREQERTNEAKRSKHTAREKLGSLGKGRERRKRGWMTDMGTNKPH